MARSKVVSREQGLVLLYWLGCMLVTKKELQSGCSTSTEILFIISSHDHYLSYSHSVIPLKHFKSLLIHLELDVRCTEYKS